MIILTIIACNLVIFISDTGAQIVTENKEKSPSRLGELWKKFVERTYIYTIIMPQL
jgi:hypothetical protein